MRRILTLTLLLLITIPAFAQQPKPVTLLVSRAQLIETLKHLDDDDFLAAPDNEGLVTDWMAIRLPRMRATKEEFRVAAELALGKLPQLNSQGNPFHPCANGERGEECSGDARGVKITPHPVTKRTQ
jgi:hypothetical protein